MPEFPETHFEELRYRERDPLMPRAAEVRTQRFSMDQSTAGAKECSRQDKIAGGVLKANEITRRFTATDSYDIERKRRSLSVAS